LNLTPFPIVTDNAECARALRDILTIVLGQGGSVHPGARWHEADGQMTVTCIGSGIANDLPLVRLPRALLVPVTGAAWAEGGDRLIKNQPSPDLTPEQQALLDLHIALYNATGKLLWTVTHHPRAVIPKHSALMAALRNLRPGIFPEGVNPARVFLPTMLCRLWGAARRARFGAALWLP
jgi:hypothetical protein